MEQRKFDGRRGRGGQLDIGPYWPQELWLLKRCSRTPRHAAPRHAGAPPHTAPYSVLLLPSPAVLYSHARRSNAACAIQQWRGALAGAPYSVLLLLLPCLLPPVLNSLPLPQLVLYSCARRSLLAELYSCARRTLLAVLYKRARRGACKSVLYSSVWRSAGATPPPALYSSAWHSAGAPLAALSCLARRGTLLALPSLCSIAGRGAHQLGLHSPGVAFCRRSLQTVLFSSARRSCRRSP